MKFILSIDGGGIRGVIPATVLAHLEDQLGMPLYKCFDLISGTSTGGIIAAGLTVPKDGWHNKPKYTAQDIQKFYMTESKKIFCNKRNILQRIFKPKYPEENLSNTIHAHIGNAPFGDLLTKVMIPTYDVTNRRPYFFKSWKYGVKDISTDRIVCATASAPTLFEPTRINFSHGQEPKYLIDGFVTANNPAMCAYTEARRLWGDEDLFILSVGAGDISDPSKQDNQKRWGLVPWMPHLFYIMMDAPINTVDYQLHTIAPDMYVRLQTRICHASEKIDDASSSNLLKLKQEADVLIKNEKHRMDRVVSLIKEFKKD